MKKTITDYGQRLKTYREKAGLSQKEFARALGVSNSVVSNWERELNRYDIALVPKICELLNISANDLLGFTTKFSLEPNEEEIIKIYRNIRHQGKDLLLSTARSLLKYEEDLTAGHIQPKAPEKLMIQRPVFLMPVSAGTGQFLDSGDYEMMEFPEDVVPSDSTFVVRVSGDSMEPELLNGTLVFVKQAKTLEPGEIGVFILNGEGFIKVCGTGKLYSFNPNYSPISIHEYDDLRIVGKVVGKYEK